MTPHLITLLVDSDEFSRETMRSRLEAAGLEVTLERPGGLAAQQTVAESHPDVVIVAVEPPIQRALQVIDFTRALLPGAMLIAYASEWSPHVERRLMQAGVNDFLHGKLSRERLVEVAGRARAMAIRRAKLASGEALPHGRVVTVVGQKGGIGKTTTSTNLAAAIAARGERSVLLIDLDTRFGDVAIMLDVKPEYTVSEVALEPSYLDREVFHRVLLEHESGAKVLPAPRDYRSWLNCSPEHIQRLIRFAATVFDVVICDTPGTYNDVVGAALEVSDRVVAITSSDPASLKNMALLVDHFRAKGRPDDDVLVTLIHGHGERGPGRADVEDVIGHPVNFEIPFDREVRKATQAGVPVVRWRPGSPAARVYEALAAAVAGYPAPAAAPDVRARFFGVFGRKARAGAAPAAARERDGIAV
ncbi:MAG: AAA family ATPase [Tepidiforma sp.]